MTENLIPDKTPVVFKTETRRRPYKGHVCGNRIEPDGSLTYHIWDGQAVRYITAGCVAPLRNRRRGK